MKSRLRSFLSKPSSWLLIGLPIGLVFGLLGAWLDRLFGGQLSTWLLWLLGGLVGGLLIWLLIWLGSKSQFMSTNPHRTRVYTLLGAVIGILLTWPLA